MTRELVVVLLDSVDEQGFDRPADSLVKRSSPLYEERPIPHLLREGVLEEVTRLRGIRLFVDELAALEPLQVLSQIAFDAIRDLPQQLEGELPTDHRRGLEELLRRRFEAIDAGGEDALNRRRNLDVGERSGDDHRAVSSQHPPVE
ncbi:MAG: hypothetical protein ACREQ9_18100 [Candidatus Binatia bacterium]